MAKIVIPEGLRGKELTSFLLENKSALLAQKKMFIKFADPFSFIPDIIGKSGAVKAAMPPDDDDEQQPGVCHVKVVANACLWCDSQMDVLITNSSKKSIQQRKGMIPHLKDHTHELEAQIGDVTDVYLEDVPLRKLGVNKAGSVQCIIMESDVRKEYNERIYTLYRNGKVKQHSIGLRYIQLELAINDEESEKEYDFWKKYYDQVINKEVLDEMGYFWVVSEISLLENSAVLFGANELTPTLEFGKSHSPKTVHETSKGEPAAEEFDLDVAIMTAKFF